MPPQKPGETLEVRLRALLTYIETKETKLLKVNVHVMLETVWQDTRLSFDDETTGLDIITGGKQLLTQLWTPHLFFYNRVETSQFLGKVNKEDFLTLFPNGSVYLTSRLKPTLACRVDLTKFPFDVQNCELSVHCSRCKSSEIVLKWDEDVPLQYTNPSNKFMEFSVLTVERSAIDSQKEGEQNNTLVIRIRLARSYGYYFLNYYLPSILIVAISWVTFWLEPAAAPGRVTLGASTMLTFIQLCWTAQGRQKVSQFMVYDVWALTCTAFIFLSLAEFAFVNTIDRKGRGKKLYMKKNSSKYILRGGVNTAAGRARLRRSSSCPSSPEIRRHFAKKQYRERTISELNEVSLSLSSLTDEINQSVNNLTSKEKFTMFSMTPQEIAAWIDEKSKIVFPLAFCIFNVIYWLPIIIVK